MSCSQAAASIRSASAPRTGARPRARAATPWTCAQRRGRGSSRSPRATCSPHEASVFMRPRLDSRGGTFTDAADRLKTSCPTSRHVPSSGTLAPARRAYLPAAFCGFRGCRSLTRAALRSVPASGSRSCPPGRFLARPRYATVREVTGRMRGIPPGVGRPDPWRINNRTRALPAARTNLPSRRTGLPVQGDLRWRRSRVSSPSSRADTRESPLRVQPGKLAGNVTTHGNPVARLP